MTWARSSGRPAPARAEGGGERRGHSDFVPGVPSTAKLLTVHWDDMEFAIPLPPVRDAS